MKTKITILLLTAAMLNINAQTALSLQGILDLNGSGSDLYSGLDGKAIHLVATADIADLSLYGLGVANNGGGSDSVEYNLSGSASAGDDILVYRVGDGSSSSTFFADYFGDCFSEFDVLIPTGLSFPDGNGDDPVELFENGVVIDFYGDVDGAAITGDPYEDGWTYKQGNGTWLDGGEDCDVESPEDYSVVSSGCPYPICSGTNNEFTSGCTDIEALNYNPSATIDDGSCSYPQTTSALSLQGILDLYGSVPTGDPDSIGYSGIDGKAIHLVATSDIADLSVFGLSVANNGGGSDGVEYTLSGSASAGDDILVYRVGSGSNSESFFANYFGDCFSEFDVLIPTGNNFPDGNGDDPVELFENGVVIDFYGDVDGSAISGDPYEDGWTYKQEDGTWLDGGEDCDVEALELYTVESSGCPYPLCNFEIIYGCTDTAALNFNPNATNDDGSCTEVLEGCTDESAFNYDSLANTFDNSCTYLGCSDSLALNFYGASVDDGSCIYDLSTLSVGLALKGILDLHGSESLIYSGFDGKAIHLVATDDIPDLSIYSLGVANNGGGTDGPEYNLSGSASAGDDILVFRVGGGTNSESFFSDYFGDCFSEFNVLIPTGIGFPDGNGDDPVELFENGVVIDFYGDVNGEAIEGDPYEDGWVYKSEDGSWLVGGEDCDVETPEEYSVVSSGCPYPLCLSELITGCTDSDALNYDLNANIDDGSCLYPNTSSALSLQGILDLNGSGSDIYSGLDGKAIHLVATANIADLSLYGLGVANNGGGSDSVEYTLSGSASAGDDILVYRVGDGSSSSTFFADYFGDCFSEFDVLIPTGLSFPDGNGDDPVELFENGVVIDFYGDVDGAAINGDPYEDGWTYKLEDGTWLDGGEDCDVESPEDYSVISSGCPYPICNLGTQGCTDQTAFNYNPEATIDDGSCILNLTNGLSLQGVLDFDLGSTGGKAIHLKANTNISDLSIFAIGTANNGGGSDGPEFTFESISVSSGDEILVVRDDSAMSIYMGSCYSEFDHIIHQNTSAINQNGNDAIELFENGIIIETFGDANVDGTGEDWEYTDSWAYLVDSTWTYGGLNCTDSTNSIFETSCVYPICPQEEVCSVPNSWDVTVTATNQTIILPSNTLISIDDQLTIDEIAIGLFFVNQIGELQCAGYTYFSGETSQIAAFGDDTTTDEIDGFQEGQEFTWLIYNCVSGETYNANGSFSNGPSVYTTNGISYVNTVTTAPSGPESQTVNLPNGWSMFSTYMIPENTALDQLLSSVVNEVIIAKDYLGAAYLPEFNFNGVGAIQVGQGYQIKMSSEQNLVVDGEYAFPEDNPISFNSGWNMIGYLRIDAAPADLVLAQLVDNNNLIIAKDFLGAAYLPEFNFNGIGDLNPGRGYQIKTNTDGILELLSNDISYRVSSHKALINKTNFFTKPTITDKNMTLVLNLNNLKKLSGNFEIAAFDKENKIVGSSKIFFPITVFPVWGDDVLNNFKDGLYNNEEIYFQIWNGKDLKKINLTSNNELILFNTNDIVHIDGVEISSKVNTDKVSIYPNPSSQFSSVEIYLNQSSIVEIDLYDMMGNFIRRIISEEYGEGNNLININIENIPDGSYFLKIKHDQKIINKHFKIIN